MGVAGGSSPDQRSPVVLPRGTEVPVRGADTLEGEEESNAGVACPEEAVLVVNALSLIVLKVPCGKFYASEKICT